MADAPETSTPETNLVDPGVVNQARAAATMMPDGAKDPIPMSNGLNGLKTESSPINGQLQEPSTPTLGGPQAPALQPAAGPPLHARIAEGIMHALGGSDGKPGDWARAVLAGGLAGLGAAATTPHRPGDPIGSGFGIGASAAMRQADQQQQQRFENQQQQQEAQRKQQALDLQKQNQTAEQGNAQERLKLAQAEDARRQVESIRDAATFEKNVALLDQRIKQGDFEGMKQTSDYLDQQAGKWDALQKVGAKPLDIDGVSAPEFDHLGDAETFAMKNQQHVIGNHALQIVRNPDSGKYTIMETPQDKAEMREVTDASGKTQQMLLTPGEYLDKMEQVAKTKHYMNTANKSSLELKEELEAYKEDGTVKGARKELTKVNGDYSKLSPGSREALLHDATDRFSKAQGALEKELQKPEELRDKDTVDSLTKMRNEYAGEAQKLWNNHPNDVGEPAPQFKALPAPAGAQPPKPGYVYGQGAKGTGWYKAPAQAAGAPAAQPQTAEPQIEVPTP